VVKNLEEPDSTMLLYSADSPAPRLILQGPHRRCEMPRVTADGHTDS
jgi:hypothetical protein